MKRVALLSLMISLVFVPGALAQQGQHTIKVTTSRSTAFTFALPDSISVPREFVRGTTGTLMDNTPQCRPVHSNCPSAAYDVIDVTGNSPAAGLRNLDHHDRVHALANGSSAHHLVWQRFTGGGLLLVAPISCARLGAHAPSLCSRRAGKTEYVALQLLGSTPPTLLRPSVDADILASVRFTAPGSSN